MLKMINNKYGCIPIISEYLQFIIIILIIIMFVIKHIDDENDKIIENKEKENKEIK